MLDLDEFLSLAAAHTVVPVAREVSGDRHTPVTVFESLVGDGTGFLLESVEGGERWARWSFVGWNPAALLTTGPDHPDPFGSLAEAIGRQTALDTEDLPPFHSGLVGYLSYDMARRIERLPHQPRDDRSLPEQAWQVVGNVAAFDRLKQTILLIANVFVGDDPSAQYQEAVDSIDAAAARLGTARGPVDLLEKAGRDVAFESASMSSAEYQAAVKTGIGHVYAGDVFQVVPSVRFETTFAGEAFEVYRALRRINPSPYMFFLRFPQLEIAGSSPELMVRSRHGRVFSRPIAGTRPRGATPKVDDALATDLLADEKERAEHVMLVDLARNDLGRICEYGTVAVDDLMVIEKYSHVQHIVSGVSGALRPGVGPVDVLRATFPHGTVTGAPKVRAMEIIDELEPVARGPYAGAVGYIDFSGNLDTAIALRTLIKVGDRAWVQAGAGVVADSDPAAEYQECVDKAAAVLAAIDQAHHA